jgi:hypothetical protein
LRLPAWLPALNAAVWRRCASASSMRLRIRAISPASIPQTTVHSRCIIPSDWRLSPLFTCCHVPTVLLCLGQQLLCPPFKPSITNHECDAVQGLYDELLRGAAEIFQSSFQVSEIPAVYELSSVYLPPNPVGCCCRPGLWQSQAGHGTIFVRRRACRDGALCLCPMSLWH